MDNSEQEEVLGELSIKYMKNEIIKGLHDCGSVEIKLDQFIQRFEEEFRSDDDRISCNTPTVILFDGPILLYAIGMNTAAILELHSILERFSLREVSRILANPSHRSVVKKILERYTMPDLAKILYKYIHILDEKDVKYAIKLNKLRNGIAHRNERVISNALLSGRGISLLDVDSEVNKIDITPFLLGGITFLNKLFKRQIAMKQSENKNIDKV